MRWLRFAILVLFFTVLQADFITIIAVTNLKIKPDLLLILLVFFAVYLDTSEAIIICFVIGFATDIIHPTMGPNIISFGLVGTLLIYLHRVIAIWKMLHQGFAIFIAGFLALVLACFLASFKAQPPVSNMWTIAFGTALYSALIGPFLFLPLAWLMRIKIRHFRKS